MSHKVKTLESKKKKEKLIRKEEYVFLNLFYVNVGLFLVHLIALILFVTLAFPIEISHILVSTLYILAIIETVLIEFLCFKEKFKYLIYSYENIYLFKKYSYICELASVVAIAFAIGLVTPFFSLYSNEFLKYISFFISASLTYLACATACTKCLLQYCYSVWLSENQKHHKKLI